MQPFCGSDAESDRESANLSRRSIHFAILYEIARGELLAAPPPLVHLSALRGRREGLERANCKHKTMQNAARQNTTLSIPCCDTGAKIKMFCTGCSSA